MCKRRGNPDLLLHRIASEYFPAQMSLARRSDRSRTAPSPCRRTAWTRRTAPARRGAPAGNRDW